MVWVQLILLVVAIVLSIVLAPKPPQVKDPSINDISVPVATESDPIPVVFGKVWIESPNVVWYGDLLAIPIFASGGKK